MDDLPEEIPQYNTSEETPLYVVQPKEKNSTYKPKKPSKDVKAQLPDGSIIDAKQYEDGSIRVRGRVLIKGTKLAQYDFNHENAKDMAKRRKELAAEKLREQLVEEMKGEFDIDPKSSAEVMAMSGALLFKEVVMDKMAYPRDRMDGWEKIMKAADMLKTQEDRIVEAREQVDGRNVLSDLLAIVKEIKNGSTEDRGVVDGRVVTDDDIVAPFGGELENGGRAVSGDDTEGGE